MTAPYNIRFGSGITIGSGITAGTIGGGGGGGGIGVKLDIGGITSSSVPDISGNAYDGALVGTYSTGSDSHGAYLHLTGNHTTGGYIDIDGYNLSTPFTVRMIMSIDGGISYWASLWGNETYSANKGYLAYLGGATSLSVGPVGGLGFYSIGSINTALVAQWDFVVDGSSVIVYKNGTQVGTPHTYTGAPSGGNATNSLYVGSRHQNNGNAGPYDLCQMKLYAFTVFEEARSSGTIATDFSTNQSTFNL
jgi:hypothetical protein